MLKRNIKRIKQVLDEKQDFIKAKIKKEIEREKAGAAGKLSELDTHSNKDTDTHSIASLSALGGYGSQKLDIKKVELINTNVSMMVSCKTAFDTMQ